MNSKKGLSRVMSALLAASSFVGQASAANVKRPAGKVKVGKNVVRKERKKKAKSAELDVGGRERRGEAINAYASPLDNPRNWADAVLGVSTLGLGITAFYKHRKALKERSLKDAALKQQGDVELFCSLAEKKEYMADVLLFCCLAGNVGSLRDKLEYESKFFYADDGKIGNEVNKEEVVWPGGEFFCELGESSGVFVGPVARTLEDDINVFVDRCLLKIIREEFGVEVKTNKNNGRTVANFRDHLLQSVDKECEALLDNEDATGCANLRKEVDAVLRGADCVRKYLHESLSTFEWSYNKQFKPKNMELKLEG